MTLESFIEIVDLSIVKLCAVAGRMQGGQLRTLSGTRKGGEEFQVELPEGGEELLRQDLHAAALRNVREVAVHTNALK